HPREAAADREPGGQHGADRLLRELPDVADVLLEQVEAAGDVAVEEERLAEGERVVLRARTGLHREGEALAAAEEVGGLERQLAEEAFELRHAGAEGELVAVLFLELQLQIDFVLLAWGLLDVDVLSAFERLEVTQLIEPLDAV